MVTHGCCVIVGGLCVFATYFDIVAWQQFPDIGEDEARRWLDVGICFQQSPVPVIMWKLNESIN